MKKRIMVLVAMLAIFLMSVPVLADPVTGTGMTGIVTESLGTLSAEILGIIGIIAPVAFTIVAGVVGVKFAIRVFRSLVTG